MKSWLAAWIVVLAVGVGGGTGDAFAQAEADDAARIEKATREVLDRRYQRELPIGKREAGPGVRTTDGKPRMVPGRVRRPEDRAREREDYTVASPISMVMRMIVYGVLIVALMMIVMWVARDLRR